MTTVVAEAVPGADATVSAPRRKWPTTALFLALFAIYFAVGWVLAVRYNLFEWDGVSRVANAGYTVMSRHPHLSAIGFVWNPLPSLIEIPLLQFSAWWPALKTYGLAGAIQSAAFTAGAALVIRQIAFDRGISRIWRWVAVGAFAFHPMVLVYGGSGMSEGPELFCLLWSARYLLRWVETRRVGDLAWTGIALSAGYLTRYEVIPAAIGVAAFVALVTFTDTRRETRRDSVILNTIIVMFPITVTVVLWALTGWVVSSELLATVTSQYGNANQVLTARGRGGIVDDGSLMLIAQRIFGMQPFTGFAIMIAAGVWALRGKRSPLVPVAIFVPMLCFAAWGHYTGATYSLFRYYMPAIPLVIVVALACWDPRHTGNPSQRHAFTTGLGAGLLTLSVLAGFPATARSMLAENHSGQQLLLGVNSLVHPNRYPPAEQWYRQAGLGDRLVADYLDDKNLPPGAVLTDSFSSAVVWLESQNPTQFLITSDYDFTAALNRPWDFGVRYILIANPDDTAAQDAITERYPQMWSNGAGIGRLVFSALGPTGLERWRLYEVVKPSNVSSRTDSHSAELAQPGR